MPRFMIGAAHVSGQMAMDRLRDIPRLDDFLNISAHDLAQEDAMVQFPIVLDRKR